MIRKKIKGLSELADRLKHLDQLKKQGEKNEEEKQIDSLFNGDWKQYIKRTRFTKNGLFIGSLAPSKVS